MIKQTDKHSKLKQLGLTEWIERRYQNLKSNMVIRIMSDSNSDDKMGRQWRFQSGFSIKLDNFWLEIDQFLISIDQKLIN